MGNSPYLITVNFSIVTKKGKYTDEKEHNSMII